MSRSAGLTSDRRAKCDIGPGETLTQSVRSDWMQKEFTIDKVAWHTKTEGNPESRERIIRRFYSLVNFLQDHRLTNWTLATSIDEITAEFSIKSSDFTETGVAIMKRAYDKWLKRIDRGSDPEDVGLLKKEIDKLRD
jgi:hypothetical protein